ncbi:unnamed protein product [Arabidopsis thaliana]|uniref:DUF3741 domain-containing protein n=1 Tax=Arabidopsis thaliana TaxID=3702 RepID=A0A654GCH2_ARATH|nr:unnamed protein product [Arabidopsis thaliana]
MKSSPSPASSLSLGSKTRSFGCISIILQRFLCSGTSSTYPSDLITEPSFKSRDFIPEPLRGRGDGPGAVARLMGLDSIPVIDKTRFLSRSHSVNHLKRDDDEIQGKHRRVKSTLEYVELEDDDFFILSFEKDKNDKELGTRNCKKRRDTRENQSKTEDQTHLEGKENNINAMNVSPGRERLEIGELMQRRKEKRKSRRKRKETKLRQNIEKENWVQSNGCWSKVRSTKEEEECGSCDDSSPVSVLDYDRYAGVRVTPSPGNISRRRLSSELESSKLNETIEQDHITLTSRSKDQEIRLHGYQEMWLMICKLTVSDLEGSDWFNGKALKLEDIEGIISEDIVSNILDQLLEETITTLSLTSQV